ncbi:LacI family DNA-binding transcriptional regulator [Nocardiopsis quinghaiensis]|uniref:LacI family DNA-binding transcriptional regulator n=1 Tax=Nocardiopsis quinghaiensis TaxID=464995 RepID=UPI00123C37FB|nr:LacI family DNA-binding transcriptional regulator [Nocardiopsis quinghaiensis]
MGARRSGGRPTISDVAALAGVSVSAVSKVVNNKGSIAEPTRRRVLDAVGELQWSPSAAAVALRGARTRAIGMVSRRPPDLLTSDPHFTVLISGIERELAPVDYGLLLHIVGEQEDAERRAYRRLAEERRVDGVILTESLVSDTRFDLLRGLGLPAVLIGTPWREDPVPVVRAPHQERGVTEAVEHLAALGHRRVAYVLGPEDRVHTGFRRRVLEEAALRHGLSPVLLQVSDFTAEAAAVATEESLSLAGRPTAILYANDMMAIAGINAARRRGLEVPRDLSVVGHDDLPLGALVQPRLTTVGQDLVGLGRAAALRLVAELDGTAAEVPAIAPPRLVVRESTAAPGA